MFLILFLVIPKEEINLKLKEQIIEYWIKLKMKSSDHWNVNENMSECPKEGMETNKW